MSKWPASWRIILPIVFCCILSGCLPVSETPLDDEKDPNVIEGRKLETMLDYKGAVDAYERAVQANPRNATAHLNVGVLYENRIHDPLAAAFHYQRFLELRPKSEYTQVVGQHLLGCKMEIAKTVTYGVVTAQVHQDMAKLKDDLAAAKLANDQLRAQIAAKPMVVTNYVKYFITNVVYVTNTPAPVSPRFTATNAVTQTPQRVVTNSAPRVTPLPSVNTNTVRRLEQRASSSTVARTATQTPTSTRVRTYAVRSGETMAEVARRSGVSLQKLMSANPSVDPKRLKPGQTLNIPTQ